MNPHVQDPIALVLVALRVGSLELGSVEVGPSNEIKPSVNKLHIDGNVARPGLDLSKQRTLLVPNIDGICHPTVDVAGSVDLHTVGKAGISVGKDGGGTQPVFGYVEGVDRTLAVEVG